MLPSLAVAFFTQWWDALNLPQQVFYGLALIASLVIVVLGLFALVGLGGHDVDHGGMDGDDGDGLFSLKPITGFLFAFGWAGGASVDQGLSLGLSVLIAFLAGGLAMFGIMTLLRATRRLRSDGTLRKETALGKVATVYVTLPPRGAGQVIVPIDGRTITLAALHKGETALPAETKVRILEFIDSNTVRVEPVP